MDQQIESPNEVPKMQPVDKYALQAELDRLKTNQNLPSGIIGGLIGGALGAAIWAVVVYFSEYQIGWIAILVGYFVGFGVRKFGRGVSQVFGFAGAGIALFSVGLGNFLVVLALLAKYYEVSFLDVLVGFDYTLSLELLTETFQVMDILFYIIAIAAGYRNSFVIPPAQQKKLEDLLAAP